MGVGEAYSAGRETGQWLSLMYAEARARSAKAGVCLPAFEEFWEARIAEAIGTQEPPVMLAPFRPDPEANPLPTPSPTIPTHPPRLTSFGYADRPPHPPSP